MTIKVENLTINLTQQTSGMPMIASLLRDIANKEAQPEPVAKVTPPAIGEKWPGLEAEYMGITRGQDGQPDAHLIAWVEEPEPMGNKAAIEWCKGLKPEYDSHLPDCIEGALLYANGKDKFKTDNWYWLSTQYSEDNAYGQDFDVGTQTTATSSLSVASEPSADTKPSFAELVQAYLDCRKHKRNTQSALAFEERLERNLFKLHHELLSGTYTPGKSICFVITRPKAREVWAADFRDRIVHHLLYNKISPRFYASFIADSCACIPGRGTLYAAQRLEAKVRSVTQNWSRPAFYLKMDLANFFVAIDKKVLEAQIAHRVNEPWWRDLANLILWHDPRQNFELRGNASLLERVPAHKRLVNQDSSFGLPIGNLSSQFFANIYLDALDQFAKHQVKAKHYIRYVDDFVLLHESPQWLNAARERIEAFLIERLNAKANPAKTILQPINRGVDFVGQVIKPWHRTTRRRTVREAIKSAKATPNDNLLESANSYFGLLGQATASHHDRAKLANVLRYRGRCVSGGLTKIYRTYNETKNAK